MTPERYRQIGQLYHSVLELTPDERPAFLAQACGGDEELLREVQTLIASHEQAGSFIESPAIEVAAEVIAEDSYGDMAGRHLGHYEIKSLLGAGGMGEVYLALDTRLGRRVALKLLPGAFINDAERVRRFEQEARAASALNHPNILTIYEIERVEDRHFIAMEYIDGETLREMLYRERTPLPELLKCLQQVAEGLAKAHAAGIVHRDLKPDNIMVTRDGYAKVLDFGLAKLIEQPKPAGAGGVTSSDLAPALYSLPGMVRGTVGYMSPEQAQGRIEEIDHRSDIFSFGCILFEAVTGHRPFADESVIKSLHRVAYEDAPPIRDFNPSAPPDLQRIVRLCLAKDRAERYQTIKDVANELKEVRWGPAGAVELVTTAPTSGSTQTLSRQAIEQTAGSTSSAEYLSGQLKRRKRNAAITSAALIIAVAALAYFFYFKRNRASALTEQDTILLVDFDNKTGDEIFDDTLKQGLAVQLEQSPFLNLFPDTRVRGTLKLMSRSPDARVTPEIGREVCQRQGLKALIAGSIAPLGSHYVLTLSAINSNTGEVLAREQAEAENREQVLKTLSQAASRLRGKLGESLNSIQKFDAPLEATTSSLEALKAYSLGRAPYARGDMPGAIRYFKRAVEIDTNFGLAYSALAFGYANSNQSGSATQYADKAYALRDRVSERERLVILDAYYLFVTGEIDKRIDEAELRKRLYPRDYSAFTNLSLAYAQAGQFEKAVPESREALRLNPNVTVAYIQLGGLLINLNRFAEAREICEQAFQKGIDSTSIHNELYRSAFVNGDAKAMQEQVDWAKGKSDEYVALDWQTGAADFAGQRRRAQEFSRRAIDLAMSNDAKEVAAGYAAEAALRSTLFGQCTQTKAAAKQALALEHSRLTTARAVLALALCGEASRAQRLIDDLVKDYPRDTRVNGMWVPAIRAALELRHGNARQAVDLLQGAKRYEAAGQFWPQYLRGLAYLQLGLGAEAAAEFQQILDHRGQAPLSVLYPLAHLGLARAATTNGDATRARQAYQDFFSLWKDADADLPLLIDANKEYEQVK